MQREHNEEYRKLGLNISYFRKERGLSQMQLAEKIDVSRTHMSRIENNDCAVSLDVIFSIAAFCGAQRQLVRWPTAAERR